MVAPLLRPERRHQGGGGTMLKQLCLCLLVSTSGSVITLEAQPSWTTKVGKPPKDFVGALVDAGIPAGLELRRSDDSQPEMPDSLRYPDRDNRVRWPPATEIVERFNQQHRDYRAEVIDGVIVVRPIEQRSMTLDREVEVEQRIVLGAMDAERAWLTAIDPTLGVGGVAGSTMSSPERRGDGVPIYVGGVRQSLVSGLNAIVRQVPHQAWLVITERRGDRTVVVQFGLIHADASTDRSGLRDPAAEAP